MRVSNDYNKFEDMMPKIVNLDSPGQQFYTQEEQFHIDMESTKKNC